MISDFSLCSPLRVELALIYLSPITASYYSSFLRQSLNPSFHEVYKSRPYSTLPPTLSGSLWRRRELNPRPEDSSLACYKCIQLVVQHYPVKLAKTDKLSAILEFASRACRVTLLVYPDSARLR